MRHARGRWSAARSISRRARGATIAALAAFYTAGGCSSQEAGADRLAACRKLCESAESLVMECGFDPFDQIHPLAWFISPGPNCVKGCERTPLNPDACAERYDDLMACAAESGFECEDDPNFSSRMVVAGCDQAAFDFCDACGCCTTPPSVPAGSTPCLEKSPYFFHCGSQSGSSFQFYADPSCYPACQSVGPHDYCCEESSWGACNPSANPQCQDCDATGP